MIEYFYIWPRIFIIMVWKVLHTKVVIRHMHYGSLGICGCYVFGVLDWLLRCLRDMSGS